MKAHNVFTTTAFSQEAQRAVGQDGESIPTEVSECNLLSPHL